MRRGSCPHSSIQIDRQDKTFILISTITYKVCVAHGYIEAQHEYETYVMCIKDTGILIRRDVGVRQNIIVK